MTLIVGIAGITGRFGRLLARELLCHPSVIIQGYCRNPNKLDPSVLCSDPSRIQITQGEALDASKITEFVRPCDVVVCAYLGDNALMVGAQKLLIDACDAARVPRYVASDWSLDYTRLDRSELPPKDPMKLVKAYLETMKHVKGVHVFNGVFMEALFSPFFGAYDFAAKKLKYWGNGTEIIETTTYQNAAQYTAAIIMDPSAVGIQRILGDRKCMRDIARLYEHVFGEKLGLVCLGSVDGLAQTSDQIRAMNPNDPAEWVGLFRFYMMLSGHTFVGPELDNGKYPSVKPVTIEEFMRSRGPWGLAAALSNL